MGIFNVVLFLLFQPDTPEDGQESVMGKWEVCDGTTVTETHARKATI